MKRALSLLVLTCAGQLAAAQTTIGVSSGIDRLSGNAEDWHETAVTLRHQAGPRTGFGLGLARVERFGLNETQASVAADLPLSDQVTASLDANASNEHRILARHAFGATLQYEFAKAWLLHAGGRSSSYDDAHVNLGLLMLEHYFSNYSVAAGWRAAHTLGTTTDSGELRASYYYGEHDSLGVVLAGGKEAVNIGGLTRLSSVRSATLVGRHWLDRRWAVTYALGHTRQGDFYNRTGLNLGLQAAF